MAETAEDLEKWAEQVRLLLGNRRERVTDAVRAGLVRSGRLADPGNADPLAAEAARARREDVVQNVVADRTEVGANTILIEDHATGGADKLLIAAQASEAKANTKYANAQAAYNALAAGHAQKAAKKDLMDKAQAEAVEALNRRVDYEGKSAAMRALKAGAATVAAGARIDRVRNAVDLSDPILRRTTAAALLKVTPGLAGVALDQAVDAALKDGAESSFLKQLGGPVMERLAPGAAHTDTELKDKGRERLLAIEAEQIVSAEIAARIAKEVDQVDGKGEPQRIVNAMQRVSEIEAIVNEVAAGHGYTNIAHFISRHGAARVNPDAGETKLAPPKAGDPLTLAKNDPTKPETRRTSDDAAARVIAGVSPDHATPQAHQVTQSIVVTDIAGVAQPNETVNVPQYADLGDDAARASSQHASAKAALFMLDEGVAQAARASRENPGTRGHTMDVIVGREDVAGEKLGAYSEDSGLGASYQVNEEALADADRLKQLEVGDPLDAALIGRRMLELTKTVGATSAKVTLLADELHGGFSPMTMFSQSAVSEMNVQDKQAGQEARALAKTAAEAAVTTGTAAVKAAAVRAAAETIEALALKLAIETSVADASVAAKAEVDAKARALALIGNAARTAAEKTATSGGAAAAAVTLAGDNAEAAALILPANTAAAAAAGATAKLQTQALVDKLNLHRAAALEKQKDNAVEGQANVKAKADAARNTASVSAGKRTLAEGEAKTALSGAAVGVEKALLDQASAAGAALTVQLQAQARADQAAAALLSAELRTSDGVAQAGKAKSQATDRHAAAVADEKAAVAELARIESIISAAGATVPERLLDARADIQAQLAQKKLDLEFMALAEKQADGLQKLAAAKNEVLLARKDHEALLGAFETAQKGADAAATKLAKEKFEAAELLLAAKRKARDGVRKDLAALVPPGHPALGDEADEAAAKAAAARAQLAQASQGAQQKAAELDLAVGAQAPAQAAAAKAKLGALAAAAGQAGFDEAAAAQAARMQAAADAQLKEALRAQEVLDKGEAAVAAAEAATEATQWAAVAGEDPKAYEARMKDHLASLGVAAHGGSIQDMLAAHAAQVSQASAAARERNDAEKNKLAETAKSLAAEQQKQAAAALANDQLVAAQKAKVELAKEEATRLAAEADQQAIAAENRKLEAAAAADAASVAQAKAVALQSTPGPAAAGRAAEAALAEQELAERSAEAEALQRAAAELAAQREAALAPLPALDDQISRIKTGLKALQAQLDAATEAGDTARQMDLMAQRTRLETALKGQHDQRGKAMAAAAKLDPEIKRVGEQALTLQLKLDKLGSDAPKLAAEAKALREAELAQSAATADAARIKAEKAAAAKEQAALERDGAKAKADEAAKLKLAAEAAATQLAETAKEEAAQAQAKLDAVKLQQAQAQKAYDKVKVASERVAAELAQREKQEQAQLARSKADIEHRMAAALSTAEPASAAKQQAATVAKLRLDLASKQALLADAEATLHTADRDLATAKTRLASATKSHADALAKAAADQTPADVRLIAGWTEMKPRLDAAVLAAEGARKQAADAHVVADNEAKLALATAKAGGAA